MVQEEILGQMDQKKNLGLEDNTTLGDDFGPASSITTTPEPTTLDLIKRYEYQSPETIYSLQMTLFQEEVRQNDPNKDKTDTISKFTPVLDTAVKTLRVK